MKTIVLFLTNIALIATSAVAGIIFQQPSSGSGGYMSSTVVNTGSDAAQLVWQGFSVPVTTTLREIQWTGKRSVVPVDFQISIGTSMVSISGVWNTGNSANETPSGTPGVYNYRFTLPAGFVLTGGQTYLLMIVGMETTAPDWQWGAGSGGPGRHAVRTPAVTGDFIDLPSPGDVAFTLLNQATVPVPVTVAAMPSAGGTVTGGGTYSPGANVTAIATPAAGRTLLNWTVGGVVVSTSTTYTFPADGNTALIANFSGPNTGPYIITGVVNPDYPGAGTIGGAGTIAAGNQVDLDCSPIDGLQLVSWSENNVIVSTNAVYSFTATKDRVIQANITDPAASYFMQSVVSPANTGSISINSGGPTGHFNGGSLINFVATPATGYHLVSWKLGSNPNPVGTGNTLPHIVAFDNVVLATFAPDNPYLLLGVIPVASGTATGTGAYAYGSTVTATAAPAVGYVFSGWKNGATVVSTNPSYTLTLTDGTYLTANFTAQNRTITAAASPLAGGSVTGAGVVGNGATVTLTETPNAGYNFTGWTLDGAAAGITNPLVFNANANHTFVANYVLIPSYTITAVASPLLGGNVSGGGDFLPGLTASLLATPNAGYYFIDWSESATTVSTLANYSFTVSANHALVANFGLGFTVAASPSFAPGGSVSGAGGYAIGGTVTLLATPAAGYQFTNWTEGGIIVSTSGSYTYISAADRNLVANFVPIVGIGSVTPGELGITWPASAVGWVLQESGDLSPASWQLSALPVTTSGGQSHASVTNPSGSRFFRLAHP